MMTAAAVGPAAKYRCSTPAVADFRRISMPPPQKAAAESGMLRGWPFAARS